MRWVPESQVRAAIARHILGGHDDDAPLGEVELHPHQRNGASRIRHLLNTRRGALLADDVGLGKTYVALAVARNFRAPLVVAPASLRETWNEAATKAAVSVRVISLESLGRGTKPSGEFDLIIVDEAHNLRNQGTRRFDAARTLCATAPVLLLSATPVQNRVSDVRTVMSLFLGELAHSLSIGDLSAMIVRRSERDVAAHPSIVLPSLDAAQWLDWGSDIDCMEDILSLPPPVAAADSGDAGLLLTWSLVRQWSSSRAALVASLSRRLARGLAIEDSLNEGRLPTRAELASWCCVDSEQQMAFAFMASPSATATTGLRDHIGAHVAAIRDLLNRLRSAPDPDVKRAETLVRTALNKPGRRIVAFSEYAATVEALYRLMAPHVQAAMLTHAGGRVVGGRLPRREVLRRFRPGERVADRDRNDVLLSTDVLSEGVSLHDASVVIHLDLPWNPARLSQRVGRLRRLGAPSPSVSVYAMTAPAPAERMLELHARLTAKLRAARTIIGASRDILPDSSSVLQDSAAARRQRVAAKLGAWRQREALASPVAGAVRASCDGVLACVRVAERAELLAVADTVSDDSAAIEGLIDCVLGGDADHRQHEVRREVQRLRQWLAHRRATDVIDLPARRAARARRKLLERLDRIGDGAPRHARASLIPMLRRARSVATAALSAGAECVLDELASAELNDAAWLQAVAQFASLNAKTGADSAPEILALLLLRR